MMSWLCNTDIQTSSSDSDSCGLEDFGDIRFPDGCPEVFLPGCFDALGAFKDICIDTESNSESSISRFCSELETGELRGVVTQMDRWHFSEFFGKMVKEVTQEKDTEKVNVNEGFLFHPKQVCD